MDKISMKRRSFLQIVSLVTLIPSIAFPKNKRLPKKVHAEESKASTYYIDLNRNDNGKGTIDDPLSFHQYQRIPQVEVTYSTEFILRGSRTLNPKFEIEDPWKMNFAPVAQ